MKVEIKVTVEVQTALCIGSGVSASTLGIDRLTLRNHDGNLLIPGSALKGKLRMGCEQILKTLTVLICQSPNPASMCPHYFWIHEKREKKEDNRENREGIYCPICEIFGSPWSESPLEFADLVWDDDVWKKHNTSVRPGIAISRSRGVVEEDKLFYTETSPPNAKAKFKGNINGYLKDNKQIALMLTGLKNIRAFGNSKSRGLGWSAVSCDLRNPDLTDEEIADAMKGWINGKNT